MNILYVAFVDFSQMHYGPAKKILSACKAMERDGHTVTLLGRQGHASVRIHTDGKTEMLEQHGAYPIGRLQVLLDKSKQVRAVERYVREKTFDFCYIRFDLCTGEFMGLLKKLDRVCKQIFIELPTYPYEQEYVGFISKLRLRNNDRCAVGLKKYVDRIVTFYPIPGDRFFDVPCLTVPNGFDFDTVSLIRDDRVPERIHIAAVSAMRHWHGYERMIEGLHRYYAAGGQRDIVLHMVGEGREGPKYLALTKEYGLEERVLFHGPMFGDDLANLLEQCTLGVDSLARHRTNISVLSSLKSREYGAKGIPLINSCRIDIIEDGYPYLLLVPADETPVDIETVVAFYDRIYAGGSRIAVAKEIREYIEPRSDMHAVMQKVLAAVSLS